MLIPRSGQLSAESAAAQRPTPDNEEPSLNFPCPHSSHREAIVKLVTLSLYERLVSRARPSRPPRQLGTRRLQLIRHIGNYIPVQAVLVFVWCNPWSLAIENAFAPIVNPFSLHFPYQKTSTPTNHAGATPSTLASPRVRASCHPPLQHPYDCDAKIIRRRCFTVVLTSVRRIRTVTETSSVRGEANDVSDS